MQPNIILSPKRYGAPVSVNNDIGGSPPTKELGINSISKYPAAASGTDTDGRQAHVL